MNLTTPPPVEDLDPDYAEQIRAQLVKKAQGSERKRSGWVPVLAAACGIAVITTGVVVLAESGDDGDAGPAATVPTSSPTLPEVKKVPANSSPRISLDLGPASAGDANVAARKCLAQREGGNGAPNPVGPADAETATVHQARWMKVLPGAGGQARPSADRILVQSLTTHKGVWVQCVGTELYELFDPVAAGMPFEKSVPLNAVDPINGSWTIREVPDGASTLLFAGYRFSALPAVAKVEVRIRWTGGASPWYGVPVTTSTGYVTASQLGAVHERRALEIDFRAFDKNGRQIFSDIEFG